MSVPGPAVLGRGVIVLAESAVPTAWADVDVVDVRSAHDHDAVGALHDAWLHRRPVVVRLHVDPASFREPESFSVEPWKVDPSFDPVGDRLHFLVWANNYDARAAGEPIWWWTRKAERLGAKRVESGTGDDAGDVVVDRRPVWIDGGPRQSLDVAHIHRETVDLGRLSIATLPTAAAPSIALADDQMAAVGHDVGPARIIAPAGSGKTRVITERLRYLLGTRAYERETVTAVAYNKRAQQELAQRCAAFRPNVVTLNALGWELLGRPTVIDEREVRRIVERLVPAQRRRANVDPIGPYLEAFSRVRSALVDPADVEEERDDVPGFADAFDPFREELRSRGVVDFDEQIYGAVQLLLEDGAFRRNSQQRFRHLLVDEFQDLTPAHVLMVRLLAAPEYDVFGVGDDDQVIYGHAGADPRFIVGFDRYFPGATAHALTVNYRCPARVVDVARNLLSYNAIRVAKEIGSAPGADPSPSAIDVELHDAEDGARRVVELVQHALDSGAAPSDIAVLTRVNSLLLAPQVALRAAGIPVTGALDARVLDRTGARAALAYLRIGVAGTSGFARSDVLEVLRRPSRGLPQWIDKWFRSTTMRTSDLRSAGTRLDDDKVADKLDSLAADLDMVIAAAAKGTTRSILRVIKDRVGLGQAMSLLDASSSASHLDDLEALEQVADLHPEPEGFETWLRETLSQPTQTDGVTLATVHRVKGQEWPHVIVFGVSNGLLPHRLTEDNEEERRVLHVAITRGLRTVSLLTDRERPSPFLAELDGSAPRGPRRATSSTSPSAAKSAGKAPGKASEKTSGKTVGNAAATVDYDTDVYERLRSWRSARAKADNVPPYVVLHDKHLQALAAARPTDLRGLGRVDGMGPRRIELYADDLLALLTQNA